MVQRERNSGLSGEIAGKGGEGFGVRRGGEGARVDGGSLEVHQRRPVGEEREVEESPEKETVGMEEDELWEEERVQWRWWRCWTVAAAEQGRRRRLNGGGGSARLVAAARTTALVPAWPGQGVATVVAAAAAAGTAI